MDTGDKPIHIKAEPIHKHKENRIRSMLQWLYPTNREELFFFSLVIITVLPVWAVTYFPSQDGPIHLWILHLISNYSGPESEIIRQFFEPNMYPEPNLGFYIIAYPLSLIFGIAAAEKIFLTLLTLILCYGVRYAVSTINPDAKLLSYLSIPLAFGLFTHMGFFNFQLGIALFLPVTIFCIFQYHKEGFHQYWKIGIAGLLLILGHLVSFGAFLFTFGLYIICFNALCMFKTRTFKTSLRKLSLEILLLTAVLLPGILIALSFILRHGMHSDPVSYSRLALSLKSFFLLSFLQSFDRIELALVAWPYLALIALVFVTIALNTFRYRQISKQAIALSIVLLGLFILYLYAPISSNGVRLNPRLAPLVILTGLAVLAAFSRNAKLWMVMVLSAGIIVSSAGYRYIRYTQFEKEFIEIMSIASSISPSSTFLHINFEEPFYPPIWRRTYPQAYPTHHAGGIIAIERDAIHLRSPLMSPSHFAYFPFVFKEDKDPFVLLGNGIFGIMPHVNNMNFVRFRQSTGNAIDYIIIEGLLEGFEHKPFNINDQIQDELELNYKWIISSDNGRYHLYKYIAKQELSFSCSGQ